MGAETPWKEKMYAPSGKIPDYAPGYLSMVKSKFIKIHYIYGLIRHEH